jgi:hypothetical protein
MNSEDAKTRRNLQKWIRITGTTQTLLFVLLISPFVWGLVSVATTHRVPAAVKDVRQLATQIRPHVADGKLVTYLADCEERIQVGAVQLRATMGVISPGSSSSRPKCCHV